MEGSPWKVLRDTGSQTTAAAPEDLSCSGLQWWGWVTDPDLQDACGSGPVWPDVTAEGADGGGDGASSLSRF